MADLWEYVKNLFKTVEESSPSQPVIHEMIERSEEEKADYEAWKKTLARRRLLDWLLDQYSVFQLQPRDIDGTLDFLNTPSSKGFVIHFFLMRYNLREIVHFFDFLKEKVLRLNYRTYMSDTRTFSRKNWVETIQRHYLKPPINRKQVSPDKFNQRYGNIIIELELRDDKPHRLKFSATTYSDHLYKEAEDFKSLLQDILSGE